MTFDDSPAWQASFPLEPGPDTAGIMSSRLLPRSNFAFETGQNTTFVMIRQAVGAGNAMIAFNMATRGSHPENAVNPAFGNSVYFVIVSTRPPASSSSAVIAAVRAAFINGTMAKIRDIGHGSGTYVNEAGRWETDSQRRFLGR